MCMIGNDEEARPGLGADLSAFDTLSEARRLSLLVDLHDSRVPNWSRERHILKYSRHRPIKNHPSVGVHPERHCLEQLFSYLGTKNYKTTVPGSGS